MVKRVTIDGRKRIIVLPMIAYTSGFLHAGHIRSYTACDAIHRWFKLQGYDSYLPFGYDAHGLPTEIKAREEGMNPVVWTRKCVDKMNHDLSWMDYDFHKVQINTSSPEYYLQQQWLFVQLHSQGLIYRDVAQVNWDPVEKTTLANEQVQDGRAIRTGNVVENRQLDQWFFRLSSYARELTTGLDEINWDEGVKNGQRKWIGYEQCYGLRVSVAGTQKKLIIPNTPFIKFRKCFSNDPQLTGKRLEIDGLSIPIVMNKHLDSNYVKLIGSKEKNDSVIENSLLGKPDLEEVDFTYLKDWCISRQRSFGCPIPAIHCEKCGWVVDEKFIVVSPVDEKHYEKTLDRFTEWSTVECPGCGSAAQRDSDTLDVLFDSSWYPISYFNELPELKENKFPPVSVYIGGNEHTNGHLIYIRAMFKAMNDIGLLVEREPVLNFIPNGMINNRVFKLRDQYVYPENVILDPKTGNYHNLDGEEVLDCGVEKMSKSKKNVVRLEKLLSDYSSSEIRLTILSNYPIQKDYQWDNVLINKVNRSLRKFKEFLNLGNCTWDLSRGVDLNEEMEGLILGFKHLNELYLRLEFNKIIAYAHTLVNQEERGLKSYLLMIAALWPIVPNLVEKIIGNESIENMTVIFGSLQG